MRSRILQVLVGLGVLGCVACGGGAAEPALGRALGTGGSGSAAVTTGMTASSAGGGGGDSASTSASSSSGSGGASGSCHIDAAFGALSMAFDFPTAKPLALALSDLTYDVDARPITVVLLGDPAHASATVTASATDRDAAGADVFPANEMPAFAAAMIDASGFATASPSAKAFLRLHDPIGGDIGLELANVNLFAKEDAGCQAIWVEMDAEIPGSMRDVAITTADGPHTIGELGASDAPPDKQPDSFPVHASFVAQSISFDFASIP